MQNIVEHLRHYQNQFLEMGDEENAADLLQAICLLTNTLDINASLASICTDSLTQLKDFYARTPVDTRYEIQKYMLEEAESVAESICENLNGILLSRNLHNMEKLALMRTFSLAMNTFHELLKRSKPHENGAEDYHGNAQE